MNLQELLTPENLHAIQGLELLARITVDTFQQGLNTSQKVGLGQEFSQYRSYQVGDDIRMLDWKVYARTERYYIREADLQSHIHLRFVIDNSASMLHEDNNIRKIDFARYLVATLAYLGIQQGDPVGLYAINTHERKHISSRIDQTQLHRLLYTLVCLQPKGRLPGTQDLEKMIPSIRSKDLYIVITDMYELDTELHHLLQQLAATRNEVLLFHILGKNEWDLPYQSATFEDLETGEQIQVNAGKIRASYQEHLQQKVEHIRSEMLERDITYELMLMNQPPYQAIAHFLERRKRLIS